jgi:hypothetical protein
MRYSSPFRVTWNVSFGFWVLTHLPRYSDPLDAHPVRTTALSRQIVMKRRIKVFIQCLQRLFSKVVAASQVQDYLLPRLSVGLPIPSGSARSVFEIAVRAYIT